MKKALIILGLSVLLFACKKSETSNAPPSNNVNNIQSYVDISITLNVVFRRNDSIQWIFYSLVNGWGQTAGYTTQNTTTWDYHIPKPFDPAQDSVQLSIFLLRTGIGLPDDSLVSLIVKENGIPLTQFYDPHVSSDIYYYK